MQVSTGMVIISIIWAYGQISLKKCVNVHSIQINFNFGIVLTVISTLLYPIFVTNPMPMSKIYLALILCGAPIAVSNLLYVHAMRINKNTGLLNLLMFLSVVVGYGMSIFRYGESVNIICLLGSLMILLGLMKTFLQKD
jgi:drug/metabolite transporter (DMT)-like permease